MNLLFTPEAERVLLEIAFWVEQKNTSGSGERFINRFIDKIEKFVQPNVGYPLCKNAVLAARKLSCISVDKWVLAFNTAGENFTVHFIIWDPV